MTATTSDDHADRRYSTLRLERVEADDTTGIRVLTLDRPERLNVMSITLIDELHAALDELRDDGDARVLILTGAGRGFCSGLDLIDLSPAGASSADGRVACSGAWTSSSGSPRSCPSSVAFASRSSPR